MSRWTLKNLRIAAEILISNKLFRTVDLVELDTAHLVILRNGDLGILEVHVALVRRAVRGFTDAAIRQRAKSAQEALEAASAQPGGSLSVRGCLALLGGSSASAEDKKDKSKAPQIAIQSALATVDVCDGLCEAAWPSQDLIDELADMVAKRPGVVPYIDLAKRARPFWFFSDGDLPSEDEEADSLKALARAIKGEDKKKGGIVLPFHAWSAAFMVCFVCSCVGSCLQRTL